MSRLEKPYQEKDRRLAELGYRREFDELRRDPRFRDLMRRLRLPTDWDELNLSRGAVRPPGVIRRMSQRLLCRLRRGTRPGTG